MGTFSIPRLFDFLARVDPLVGLLWLGLAGLTVTLLVMMRTRWGQARPLRKCAVMSVFAHLLLAVYATTVHIVTSTSAEATPPVIHVRISDETASGPPKVGSPAGEEKPWESFLHESDVQPAPVDVARRETTRALTPDREVRAEQNGVSDAPSLEQIAMSEAVRPEPENPPADVSTGPDPSGVKAAEPIDAPSPTRRESPATPVLDRPNPERRAHDAQSPTRSSPGKRAGLPSALFHEPRRVPRLASVRATPDPERLLAGVQDSLYAASRGKPADWSDPPSSTDAPTRVQPKVDPIRAVGDPERLRPPTIARRHGGARPSSDGIDPARGSPTLGGAMLPVSRRDTAARQIPTMYRLRIAPDRARLAELRGATSETEAAVKAALGWLAANQAPDGHWGAKAHGAGRERYVVGRDRHEAGIHADTGMTGLALLAFLASGHTHVDGLHQSTVEKGLQYLIDAQGDDGNLGGEAGTYAFMYCHAMATFTLSEAYGMTADPRLNEPVSRAVEYTLAAQDPVGGGWRYNPGDPGDTSQFGWQLMALKSAELAGIPIPESTRQAALKYLDSVSSGRYGGLASYRPGEWVSLPMTAEALVCRQFLGLHPDHPTAREAANYLMRELPGQGEPNLYYWYYGTLATYSLQGTHWQRWNRAMQTTLINRQQKSGPMAGSWTPDTVWGGYGGRVYATALAAMCLEVYYRFLPLYLEATVPHPPLR
ncbi:MAG: prenyltransferase/squalene oxidase repeat-containing protein [Planctomycetota bacterium]|jgi:hypothetical protein